MGALCRETPKSLLSVAHVPIIDLLVAVLQQVGLGPIVLVVGHLGTQILEHVESRWTDLVCVDSTNMGGTHLLAARSWVEDVVLAVAGNVLLPPAAFVEVLQFARANPGAPAVASSRRHLAGGHLTSVPAPGSPWLAEVIRGRERGAAEWEMVDVYLLNQRVFDVMQSERLSHCRAIERMVANGERVGHIVVGDWAHFENPDDLVRSANLSVVQDILEDHRADWEGGHQ
jgi:NDP-sugar pyrophosphorylase family protein